MDDTLLQRSAAARQRFFAENGELLGRLSAEGQAPGILFITCADSRLAPLALVGAGPGDLFVVRNVANIVPPYVQQEPGTVAALEYAVMRLEVPHIVVCGHTDCGGIKGLDEPGDVTREPALSRWLELARPARRDVDALARPLGGPERHIAIVERNVVNQLDNLRSYPYVRERLAAGSLTLHGWVYYLEQFRVSAFNPDTGTFSPAAGVD